MPSHHIWLQSALLPAGWADDVLLEIAADGTIESMIVGCSAEQKQLAAEWILKPVVPGMPNLHSHAHQRAMAGLAEKSAGAADNFWSWRSVMYQMLERIGPDQIYSIASMLYLEMLQAGYTHVAEFQYLHHATSGKAYNNPAEITLQCLRAARDVGIGFTALPVLYRYGGFGEQPSNEAQKRFVNDEESYLDIWHHLEDAMLPGEILGLAPHSLRAVSEDLLAGVIAQLPAGNRAQPLHLHIAEQTREVEDCIAWSDQRPLAWLLDRFEVDQRWCLVHATHLDAAEKTALAQSGATAGLCPTTEANLGDGFFDMAVSMGAEGCFGIGSDSQISVSVTEELRWLEYGQRLALRKRNVIADVGQFNGHCGTYLYQNAVRGGSNACGLPESGLTKGANASFVVLDDSDPRIAGAREGVLLDSWIFSARDQAVFAVYRNGRKVIDQDHHVDCEGIDAAFRQALTFLDLR
nr:formimidoylglutamate deiminase-like [Nerophis lumbriciformis]